MEANKQMMTKKEMQQKLGKQIRQDTYLLISRMADGEFYDDIIKDINENRESYGIKADIMLSKKKTIEEYLRVLGLQKKETEDNFNLKNLGHKTGIYGIYLNGEIVYIGMTVDGFKNRFQSHKNKFNNRDGWMYKELAAYKDNGGIIELKPIFIAEDALVERTLTKRDLQSMELCLIDIYKPRYNVEGRIKNYIYHK